MTPQSFTWYIRLDECSTTLVSEKNMIHADHFVEGTTTAVHTHSIACSFIKGIPKVARHPYRGRVNDITVSTADSTVSFNGSSCKPRDGGKHGEQIILQVPHMLENRLHKLEFWWQHFTDTQKLH